MEQEWLGQVLQGVDRPSQEELNGSTIAQVLSEETHNPQMEGKIGNIFIDDDERFSKDYVTEGDKDFIKNLRGKTNYYFGDDDGIIDFEVAKGLPLPDSEIGIDFEVAKSIPLPDTDSDDDVTYVKYIPPPPNSPVQTPLHLPQRLKQNVRNQRNKKEKYR